MERGNIRLYVFMIFTLIIGVVISARYFSLMVLEGSSTLTEDQVRETVSRGSILDRNGRVLAIESVMDSVEAWLPYVQGISDTASVLASVLELDYEELLAEMSSRTGSVWIARKITPTRSKRIRELIEQGKLPGIYIRKERGRNYPMQSLASHLLGFTGIDNTGLDGLEYSLNDILSPPQTSGFSSSNQHGNQVFLSIDVNIQFFAEQLGKAALKENSADSVTMLVMDAQTAEILAFSSVPDFDPNTFQRYGQSVRQNRAVVGAYEPGSVFKVFSLAAMLELGKISTQDVFFCDGQYESSEFSTPIACLGVHGEVTALEIIKYSCNAGAAYASERISDIELYDFLRTLGFGAPTLLPIPGESSGLLRSIDNWSIRSKPTIAIGQEVLVSSVQIAAAATALANRGTLIRPRLVNQVVSPEGTILESYGREPIRQVLSPANAEQILLMMESATQAGGTARRIATDGIRISAKTGTAQRANPDGGGYLDDRFGASCLAIFPTNSPKYILYMLIESPRGESNYGGTIVAPVLKELVDELIRYDSIPLSGDRAVTLPDSIKLPPSGRLELGDTMPNLEGYTKRELLPLLEDPRVTVYIRGEGWVVTQTPPPDSPIEEGTTIILELE